MLYEFQEWFCLKDDRTFMIQPDRDPEFYFGRSDLSDKIVGRIEASLKTGQVPKLVLYGAYGAGKTHTLFHIQWYLTTHSKYKFEVRYVETPPDLNKKSKYTVLHEAMMDRIGLSSVRRLFEGFINRHLGQSLDEALLKYFYNDQDLVNVVRTIAQGGPPQLSAWKWLRGETLSENQLQNMGVARSPGLSDLINILSVIGKLFFELEETRLVLLVDELEQLEYVTGEEISTWETAFRKLADRDNTSTGFVMAARGSAGEELVEPLRHEAFVTRIGESANYVEIPYLHAAQDVEAFVKDLVERLVDRECAQKKLSDNGIETPIELYPFTPEALDLINQFIHDDPTRALPRELLFSLNECAAAAIDNSPIVTDEIVQEVLF